jgi:amino acid transporter
LPPLHGAAGGWDEWFGIAVALIAVGLFYWLGSRGGKGKQ